MKPAKKRAYSAMCVVLAFVLVLCPLLPVKKAHAIPPAAAAAGVGLAALAAELGISETVLMAGVVTVAAAGTGLAAYGVAEYTDTTKAPAPGFKPWDDLSDEEKSVWGDVGGSGVYAPETYQKNAIGWWAMKYGLLETGDGGGLEPTPEPDPEQDPDGHSKWQKARNVMIALAVGGGAVAFNEAVSPFIDNLAGDIRGMLFGSDNLGLTNTQTNLLNGRYIDFATFQNDQVSIDGWAAMRVCNGVVEVVTNAANPCPMRLSGNTYFYSYHNYLNWLNTSNGNITTLPRSYIYSSGTHEDLYQFYKYYLNPYWNYDFSVGTYTDGAFTGDYSVDNDYGAMSDTPEELTDSVTNNNTYQTFVNNYTNTGTEGETRAVAIPGGIYGSNADEVANYGDYVGVLSDSEVTPIPGDSPIQPPAQPTEFQTQYEEKVNQILSNPFDQLFPFCLIGDLNDLVDMVHDAGSDADATVLNGTSKIVIPFLIPGMEPIDFEIDTTPVSDLGHMVRPWTTALFVCGLLVGTFRFFLTRGGE